MMAGLADQGGWTDTLMIDATHLKTHRTASGQGLKKGAWPPDPLPGGQCAAMSRKGGRTKGTMTSKLHPVTGAAGRPLRMFATAGQRSDYIGARALPDGLTVAEHLLADRG